MNNKRNINKAQWTKFWGNLGIYAVKKSARFLRRYKYSQDFKKLQKIGVEESKIEEVKAAFQNYQAPEIQFHRFALFFRRDFESVILWTNASSVSDAFIKLFRKLHNNSFKNAKEELHKLFLLYELNKKGEGRSFEIKYRGRGSLRNIKGTIFSGMLSSKHENASYSTSKTFNVGTDTIVPLCKKSEGKTVYKFIRFTRNNNKILVKISVDSPKELNLIKYKIADYFNSYLDTPEEAGDFSKFIGFLKTGQSNHFTLIGINYFDNEFKLSIFPQNNNDKNIASYGPFRRLASTYSKESIGNLVSIRIADKEINTRNQIFVNFFTFLTEGIIGAVTLSLDDRRLNLKERTKFKQDFASDFEIPLDTLINLDTIDESEIYKLFLQNLPKKQRRLQLRTESSIRIYKSLFDNGLISPSFDSEDKGAYCFNSSCRLSFQRKWNQKYCQACKDLLFVDKKIIVSTIEEKKVAEFTHKMCLGLGIQAERFEKKLLGRKLYVVEARHNGKSACFIPISRDLNENQIEIIRFRYPNLILITSKDDKNELAQSNIEAVELYKFVQKLISGDVSYVKQLVIKAKRNELSLIRGVSNDVASRFVDDNFYKSKNQITKNFGAELFEADCYVLFSYIFGSSIWLGANKRGKAFPDGITAFPLTLAKSGCFIWDTKFSETNKIVFGTVEKNAKYVKDGKNNSTIIDNGGLRGFSFVSNAGAPNNFTAKFNKVGKGKVIKISFLNSKQLTDVYKHFKDNEQEINQNSKIKEIFLDTMKTLLFKSKRKKKAFIITDREVVNLLLKAEEKYLAMRTQQLGV
ncbi:MAG: hypothetical protein UU34_C0008G0018 [Candidatus Curtissbacteria bacterium GW2011_GWA1_41_11]|uniref:Uncharacterized protein n=1 Tax=Candidatus Curtissbacteria bacterium GW2011_GWA1_41_11 TaxID=1618409 RepID=A0A0G0UDH8_9BACT|nr:MAG: hypothetical protein UU34_C0008G0018 [Candidatus Curtissbacteria bacterium GW2011_GWA1_41_11]